MPPPATKDGTRKLSDLARHVVLPTGITSTGYPAVRQQCLDLGVRFDLWQEGLGRAILGKRANGKYAATIGGVVISIPRQVGKTFTVGAIVFALCILFPGLTVIWTAHRLKTAAETFGSMQGMAKRKRIAPFIEQILTGSGDEAIIFRNGSRILFGARERGFGRGFAQVDIEVFDEAQILTDRALDDMIPAANQSKHPAGALVFYMGTPPKPTDNGESFTGKRKKALDGTSTNMLYVEFGADPDADPDDREQWAKANPSYPLHTPEESMLRMREQLGSDESFLREGLGIWDDAPPDPSVIDYQAWLLCEQTSPIVRVSVYSVEVNMDRSFATIGMAGVDEAGASVAAVHKRAAGTHWVLAECKKVNLANSPAGFVIDSGGPAKTLIKDFELAGLTVLPMVTDDVVKACGGLADHVDDGTAKHLPNRDLDLAVKNAQPRYVGDGAFAFGRKVTTGADVTPLNSVAFAAWGHVEFGAVDAGAWQL